MNILICTSMLFIATSVSYDTDGLPKQVQKHFAVVPAGEVIVDGEHQELGTFYISKYEVSNAEYAEFLHDMQLQGDTEKIRQAAIQSAGWNIPGTSLKPFAANYHTHASFAEYPVVNVTPEGARLYCAWLEDKLNAQAGGDKYVVALPTRAEWLRASRPANLTAAYAWGASYLRNSEGKFLCNFNPIGPEQIQYDASSDKYVVVIDQVSTQRKRGTFTTAPCKSYYATSLGIYNLNGNVAEMIDQVGIAVGGSWHSTGYDVRNESVMKYQSPSPYVGFRPVVRMVE